MPRKPAHARLKAAAQDFKQRPEAERLQNTLEYVARSEEAYPYLGNDAVSYAETLNYVIDCPEMVNAASMVNYQTRKLRLAVSVLVDLLKGLDSDGQDEDAITEFECLLRQLTATPCETH